MILHKETATPLTVGIYGPWGTGKTSFMRQVRGEVTRLLAKEKISNGNIMQVEFDAWKHQVNEKLWAALLRTITKQIESQQTLCKRLWGRIHQAFSKIDGIAWLFIGGMILVAGVILGYQAYSGFSDGYWKFIASLAKSYGQGCGLYFANLLKSG